MPTSSSSSMVRLRASLLSSLRCSSSASEICRLIVRTGFRLVMGSWKIIAMLLPRMPRTSSSSIFKMSWPSKTIWPFTILPGGCGMSRMSDSAVTDLPQPDSPTRPSVSPASRLKVTPSTARTTPSRVKNCVLRSWTSSSGMRRDHSPPTMRDSLLRLDLELHPRVEGVPQAVTEEREREHDDRDADRRQEHRPSRRREHDEALVDHDPPRRCRRLDADAVERKHGLREHRARDAKGDGDDHRRQDVREEVASHDAPRRRTDRPSRLDELALLEREHLTAHEARHADPVHDRDGHEDEKQATLDVAERGVAQRRHEDEEEKQIRERVDDVGEAHQDLIGPAAVEAREKADRHANKEDDRNRHEPDEHRDLRRPQKTREDVTAELVAAERICRERVFRARPDRLHQRIRRVLFERILEPAELRHERHGGGEDHEDDHDDHPDDGGLVAEEPVPRVLPERALLADDDVELGGALRGSRTAGGRRDGRHYLATLIRGSSMP